MLSSRLTLCQSVSKLLIALILLVGCSHVTPLQEQKERQLNTNDPGLCKSGYQTMEEKHLITAAKIKSSVLTNCLKNFIKFEDNKKVSMTTCNQLSIHRSGKVRFVQVTSTDRRQLPKDFKMCLVQEYWKMSFSGLQLDRSYIINFPLTFNSI